MKTIIAVPDFTRNAHLKEILPILLAKLGSSPSPYPLPKGERDIEIIIATGLHKPPTKNQINNNIGKLPSNIKISVHNYKDVVRFGVSKKGIPIYLNKKLKGADRIITVGVVEPHLYAGYSGGAKVAVIGLAGEKTINITHHPRFLDHPKTRLSSIKNNPFRDFIEETGNLLPITYSVNIVNNQNGSLEKIFYGPKTSCFQKAVRYAKRIYEKTLARSFDIVICDIPKEKASNMYQASRAFNYLLDSKKTILKNNGLILVKADLEDGFGKGLGEKRFKDSLLKMLSPERLIYDVKKCGSLAGEHRAYMVAKALIKAKLGFISKNAYLYKNKNLPFLFFKDISEAKSFIYSTFLDSPEIYYLKNAFDTILIRQD